MLQPRRCVAVLVEMATERLDTARRLQRSKSIELSIILTIVRLTFLIAAQTINYCWFNSFCSAQKPLARSPLASQ
jgi:hypothetical protein